MKLERGLADGLNWQRCRKTPRPTPSTSWRQSGWFSLRLVGHDPAADSRVGSAVPVTTVAQFQQPDASASAPGGAGPPVQRRVVSAGKDHVIDPALPHGLRRKPVGEWPPRRRVPDPFEIVAIRRWGIKAALVDGNGRAKSPIAGNTLAGQLRRVGDAEQHQLFYCRPHSRHLGGEAMNVRSSPERRGISTANPWLGLEDSWHGLKENHRRTRAVHGQKLTLGQRIEARGQPGQGKFP